MNTRLSDFTLARDVGMRHNSFGFKQSVPSLGRIFLVALAATAVVLALAWEGAVLAQSTPSEPPGPPGVEYDSRTYHVEDGQNWISLRWTRAAGTVDGYEVLRKDNARGRFNYRVIARIENPDATGYDDHDVLESSDYYYAVRAYNAAGSGPAPEFRCHFLDSVYAEGSLGLDWPEPFGGRLVEDGAAVRLAWSAPTIGYHGAEVSPASGYMILRWDVKHGYPNWDVLVENTGSTETVFIDRDVMPNSRHVYRVRAWNDWGLGVRSYSWAVTTDGRAGPAPAAPSRLRVTSQPGGAELTWRAPEGAGSEDEKVSYRIYRRENSGATVPMVLLASGHSGTSFTDSTTAPASEYHYQVRVDGDSSGAKHGIPSKLAVYTTEYPLTDLRVSRGTLNPTFNKDTRVYFVPDVPHGDSRITLNAGVKAGYTVQWEPGTDADPNADGHQVDLEVGRNDISLLVSDSRGAHTLLYRVIIVRVDPGESERSSQATGVPSIVGTAEVGKTLTVSTLGIADGDGLSGATFGYQWIANDGNSDSTITGANDVSYILRQTDLGKTIKVQVTFTDDGGNEETLISAATEPVVAPLTARLHATPEAHNGESAFTFRIAFSEAVATSYRTLRDHALEVTGGRVREAKRVDGRSDLWRITIRPDSDDAVTVVLPVTESCDADGAVCTEDGSALSNRLELTIPGPVAEEQNQQTPPENSPATGAPSITGTARVGETLTADTSGIADADGLDNATFTHQWLADGTEIDDATGASYTLADADEGKAITVLVSFTDDAGNGETLTSAATAAVEAAVAEEEPTEPPPAPTNLTATVNADGSVTLTWDPPDDDSVTGYLILRRRPYEGERTLLVYVENTGSTATVYTDADVTAGTQHMYRVKAINDAGTGNQSNYVNVDL